MAKLGKLPNNVKKPPKWTDVYPQGTKAGDEEQRLFISLARNAKFIWRSVAALAKEANLTPERCEEILAKYHKKGMVFQNPKSEDQWSYWERTPELLPSVDKSIASNDKNTRIDNAKK